ncbi:coiled-coil domain-containing protein 167 isoform X2 [Dermochelys coriacea]|uniref:coiled-coil domain-containing protein 167 isoform X2 n=1 Tax=Dermochelys coriacea TaxID=27794 RepID=UPI001CA892A6|nr:coiled-coil domain-containing protein 167 isoform X2 [Dermochelys coriacea]
MGPLLRIVASRVSHTSGTISALPLQSVDLAGAAVWNFSVLLMSCSSSPTYSLLTWIDCLEEKLSLCRQSMEEVDLKLRREELSPEGRKSLERERSLLLTKAETYEKELKVLRKENRKNAAIAMAIVLLIIVVYTCWTM